LLLAWVFVYGGIGNIGGWERTAGFMAAHHMPWVPFFLAMTILVEVGAGLALMAGFHGRIAALILLLFLIPTTLIFHNFWAFEGMDRMMQFINFQKNLAIMGGLLMTASLGPGGLSVDHWIGRNRKTG
jgi:putative oxidoreductase